MTQPATNPQSAEDWAKALLKSWGLESLTSQVTSLLQSGISTDAQLTLALEDTPEYKARFKGNDARIKAGLPALSPAQYIAVEEQYHQIMQSYGLPSSFYDSHDDFADMIGKDVAPTELEERVKVASDTWMNGAPEYKQAWKNLYGLSDGDGIAMILDGNTALPVLQKRAQAVQIAGTAAQQGLSVDKTRAERFAEFGTTVDQARKAFSDIATALPAYQALGTRFGETAGQTQLEDASLLGDADAIRQQERLVSSETAGFNSHGSADEKTTASNLSY